MARTATADAEAIKWAMKPLKTTEINAAVIVETPWSNVLKISTHQGSVYLQQTPPELFIEVDIIQKCIDCPRYMIILHTLSLAAILSMVLS